MPTLADHLRRHLTPALMVLLGVATFVAIAADVTHQGRLCQIDHKLAIYLHAHTSPVLVYPASAYSGLGDIRFLAPLALVVSYLLARRRLWRDLLVWALGLLGSIVICASLKVVFAIPRPTHFTFYVFDPDSGFTFPSGHTMGSAIAFGLLALLWMRLKPRPLVHRLAAASVAVLLGTLTAVSLLYLGVHYLSDVLAGLALSLAWLGILRLFLPPVGLT